MLRIAATIVRDFAKFRATNVCVWEHSISRRMYSVGAVQESVHPDVVIPEVPLAEFTLERIKRYGNKIALVDNTKDKTLTFAQVCEQIKRCIAALHKTGLGKGSMVCLCTSNCVEYPVIQLATAAIGGTTTTCNPLYTEDEILQQFKLSQPRIVLADASSLSKIENISKYLPGLQKVYVVGNHTGSNSYNDFVNSSHEAGYVGVIPIESKEDVALVPYSSGTTGLPKGVMLTHHNIIAAAILLPMSLRLLPTSAFYTVLPLFHMYGFCILLGCLMRGVTNVLDERFDIERLLQTVQSHKITHFAAVPPMLLAMDATDLFDKYDTSSLQRIACAAAPSAIYTLISVQKRYNVNIVTGIEGSIYLDIASIYRPQKLCLGSRDEFRHDYEILEYYFNARYALTEFVPISFGEPLVSPLDSAGLISSNTKVKIIDVQTRKELGPRKTGEILAKGPQLMKGYLNNPQATVETVDEEGWIHTGDIGYYDEQGSIYLVGRLKELIKYKGFQVAPAEIESALLKHPKISDVAVIGIPDPEAGELPKAFVVKKDQALTEEEVKTFIEGSLAHYKSLRGGVTFIDSIPKTPVGKIMRQKLRKL